MTSHVTVTMVMNCDIYPRLVTHITIIITLLHNIEKKVKDSETSNIIII